MAWLEPLRSSVLELDEAAWNGLRRLSAELAGLVAAAPSTGGRAARSRWLLELR